MADAKLIKECQVSITNETGSGAKLLATLEKAGLNMKGVVGYQLGQDQASMHVLVEDYGKACEAIRNAGYSCETVDVALVEVEDRLGAVAEVLGRLAKAGIPVEHCYATAGTGGRSLLALRTKDNVKAMMALR